MFLFHISIALTLIALGLGVAFLLWGNTARGGARTLALTFGYIIGIIAAITLICSFIAYMKYARMYHQMMKSAPRAELIQQGSNPLSQPQTRAIIIQKQQNARHTRPQSIRHHNKAIQAASPSNNQRPGAAILTNQNPVQAQ